MVLSLLLAALPWHAAASTSSVLPLVRMLPDDGEPAWLKGRELRATYTGGVALIYEHRCQPCHRPGEVAPMSFLTYNDIRKWVGRTNTPLESLIQTRAMPPWPADPTVGHFSNAFALTAREMDVVLNWLKNGLPHGEGTYQPSVQWVSGWSIDKPDHVFELTGPSKVVDAQRRIQEFTVATSFPEDRWIGASEIRTGDDATIGRIDAGPLGSLHPGNAHSVYPAGTGRLLKKGEAVRVLVVHDMESAPNAAPIKIGIRWVGGISGRVREFREDRMAASRFTIPAGAADHEVRASYAFDADGQVVSLMPIMNLRGKDVSYRAVFPDGSEKQLLSIPAWDPNWKYRYQLATPLRAPKGTVIQAVAHFDNSDANIRNPDPTAAVPSESGVELFEGWVGYLLDSP
jgi:hypothetical protein